MKQLLSNWNNSITAHTNRNEAFLETIFPLAEKLIAKISDKEDIGFNIFQAISATHYRENFHSQIMTAFLSPAIHSEGQVIIDCLIDCLNEHKTRTGNPIDKADFQNAVVDNEKGKIDIRIRGAEHSIIIENKINDAADTYRQLPTYLKNEIDAGFEVVSIIYLPLVKDKEPDKKDWTDDEEKDIGKLMTILPAFENDETTINLHDHWLIPAIQKCKDITLKGTLIQYNSLIKKLTLRKMDKVIVGEFYETLLDNHDNFKSALSIRSMLGDLQEYRAQKNDDKFRILGQQSFDACNTWDIRKEWRTKFQGYKESNGKFDLMLSIVIVKEDSTFVQLWESEKTYNKRGDDEISRLLKKLNIPSEDFDIIEEERKYKKIFKFPAEEDKMIEFVEKILNGLAKI